VERALADEPTILVLDNCESVLPERGEPATEDSTAIFSLCKHLLEADPRTRLIFTTREPLPPPFAVAQRERELGALDRQDAIELVSEVMKQHGWIPPDDVSTTPQQIADLVEAVNRHARALVLLAPEVARRGVLGTTGDLRSLMARLERAHPGDRENSLYASVELSLRRLSAESREQVRVLAVCQGGVHLWVLQVLTGLELDATRELAAELIQVGLGEDMGYAHLRLDPGLSPYLLGELADDETEILRTRWAEAMAQLTNYLHEEHFKDTHLAAQLTLLELPNLLAMLDWLQSRWPPERVVGLASRLELLLSNLGRPQALARATRVREQAAQKLGDWSHARYLAEGSNIDRLLERGDLQAALIAAQQLLAKCRAAGKTSYPEAPYDIAMAYARLGRVLKESGAAEEALAPLAQAQRRFQKLVDAGSANAQLMASAAITETGDCLCSLGRLEEAAEAYEKAIKLDVQGHRFRDVAVGKGQLGTVRLLQKRFEEALEIYEEARAAFTALGEPLQVATIWHQIGRVHQDAGQPEAAEQAYRQSLAIGVRENDLAGQADTLNQLGRLSDSRGHLEEAAAFYGQAADAYVRLKDSAKEGITRSNLAITLIKFRRYDEARREILRAIECDKSYGHAAEPWKSWSILQDLERATDHAEAAQAARQQAIEAYLAYRRVGGYSQSPITQLYALVSQAIRENDTEKVRQDLNQLSSRPNTPTYLKTVIPRLQAILRGDRNPSLSADPELDYDDAAELQLLLESLSQD
ncbi:MAG TPA: tetratricopeptide repeat protein, partial [Thermoanaerobaculia bacterium]|nr:tetratricopeptide repeat protein [Thermoanaerobaculia bacterium]